MALFGRDREPSRATLSRFLASLDQSAVESLRTLFLKGVLARPLGKEEQPGGMSDRQGNHFLVFDVDGTPEAANPRALPVTSDRPAPQRRLRPLCASGHTGRRRGEVVRTRATVFQAHTHQWIATFGNQGLGEYLPVTTMTKVSGGYTFTRIETLLYYLSNLGLAGFAHGGRDKETGDTILIPNAFDAAVPLDLLEPCFAAKNTVRSVDRVILDRLIDLSEYDNGLVERVKSYFGETQQEGKSSLTVLDTTIHNTQRALKKLSHAIVLLTQKDEGEEDEDEEKKLDPNDPIVKEHRQLQATLRNLKRRLKPKKTRQNQSLIFITSSLLCGQSLTKKTHRRKRTL
jgi:hypothetical protein